MNTYLRIRPSSICMAPSSTLAVLDWSHSNLSKLYDIGYEAGLTFYEEHKHKLTVGPGPHDQPEAAD